MNNKRFYITSLAVLAAISAYPLVNGARMAYLSIANGAIMPGQYARYVVPYAAICASVILFAAFEPLLRKLRRFALPAGLASAYGVFFILETLIERIQIRVSGMTPLDPSGMAGGFDVSSGMAGGSDAAATADIWQAALCVVSPDTLSQSRTYALQDRLVYVMGNSAYKLHYYMISLVLITMVCALVYGIARVLRDGDTAQTKPLFMRGVSTAVLVALCVFANTTAFFRQAAPIQTPLASVLTGTFFVLFGVSTGVYAGSYLLKKGSFQGIVAPALAALCATALMYVGEAVMMGGNLYRFGTGWFFWGIPYVAVAPVDILLILLSGAMTLLLLTGARKIVNQPGKRTMTAVVASCAAIALYATVAALGPAIGNAAPENAGGNIQGCYVFDANIYTNPLSSFMAFGGLPYVYGFDEDVLYIADMSGGLIHKLNVEYHNEPVGADEFSSDADISFFSPPDLTRYSERYLLAAVSNDYGSYYGLYRMDAEIWLVEFRGSGVWTIYRLTQTDRTTLNDIRRAYALHGGEPTAAQWPAMYVDQMTLKDVYALARKGGALTLADFEPYVYLLTGEDFTIRRYEVVYADAVLVTVAPDGNIQSATLQSLRTLEQGDTVDLLNGFDAFAEYMNPLRRFADIKIERPNRDGSETVMFFEDDYFQSECRYSIFSTRSDVVYVVLDNGERMSIQEALEQRRVSVEDLVANGLDNVSMVPIENPLGGWFPILHHLHTFSLNGEAFYPSKSFMYSTGDTENTVYYDIDELIELLDNYGYDAKADGLRQAIDTAETTNIASGSYITGQALAKAGIETEIGWALSSHTPVMFSIMS